MCQLFCNKLPGCYVYIIKHPGWPLAPGHDDLNVMASLCLLDEDGGTAGRWEISNEPLAVGRGEAADIVVADDSLSRRHFVVMREGGRCVIKDLNSANGTFVDGQPVRAAALRHSDCIRAGRTLFVFTEQDSGGGTRPAATTP